MYSLTFCVRVMLHSNATRAPIANPHNSAQLGGIPYHSPKLHPGPCNSVGMRPRTDTHRHAHRRVWPQYILRRLRLTRNVIIWCNVLPTSRQTCLTCPLNVR